MALIDFTTKSGQTIASADIADIVNHLQGASGKTDAWHFRVSSGNNYLITLSDAAGAQKFSIRDSAGVEQFSVDSDGTVTVTTFTPSVLNLPNASAPSQTADGRIVWDSDDDRLTVGTGAATKVIGLSRGAGSDASATQELVYDTTAALLKVWDGSASIPIGQVLYAYKTATQVFTTDTTFADITAAAGGVGGDFAFAVAANGIYRARLSLPVTFGGTGGVKLQFTGPAAPTLVRVDAYGEATSQQTLDSLGDTESDVRADVRLGTATAFSSSFVALDSAAITTSGTSGTIRGILPAGTTVVVDVFIVNGVNAGTVVLQGAQNSNNSTTTFAAGCWMTVERIA